MVFWKGKEYWGTLRKIPQYEVMNCLSLELVSSDAWNDMLTYMCVDIFMCRRKIMEIYTWGEKKTNTVCLFNLYSLPNQNNASGLNKFKTHFKISTSKITHSNWAPTFTSIKLLSESDSLSEPHPHCLWAQVGLQNLSWGHMDQSGPNFR